MPRQFVKLEENAIMPTRSTKHSAAYDFCVPAGKRYVINPGQTVKFATNIAAQMNENEYLALHVRSSVGIKKHLQLANGTGVIDSDYFGNADNRGNIIMALYNYGDKVVTVEEKERIAQGIFMEYLTVDNDKAKGKRTGGIGSTGK